tara:strand:- start:48 stop:572 length:525 start_codon:yes stop_codon:yes gene_type:complete
MKLFFLILLLIFLSGCFQETSFINKYGQSIVLNPNQTENNTKRIETISDHKLTNLNKPSGSLSKKDINYSNKFQNIEFSSSKFLKGDPDCISIIRVKVLGSLSYDELMYELKKRAVTMGGNAIGIHDLNENKEITYANQEIEVKNSLDVRYAFIKQTNLISSVTADIFRCKSDT